MASCNVSILGVLVVWTITCYNILHITASTTEATTSGNSTISEADLESMVNSTNMNDSALAAGNTTDSMPPTNDTQTDNSTTGEAEIPDSNTTMSTDDADTTMLGQVPTIPASDSQTTMTTTTKTSITEEPPVVKKKKKGLSNDVIIGLGAGFGAMIAGGILMCILWSYCCNKFFGQNASKIIPMDFRGGPVSGSTKHDD